MRGFLGFVAFVLVLVGIGAALAVPPIVGPVVVTAVKNASPFGTQPLDVQADVDAIGLIRGFVREIRVSGTNLERDGVTISSLDIAVQGVGIGDHDFSATTGALEGVLIPTGDGSTISVDRISLSGPSTALTAKAHLDRVAALAFVQHALDSQGLVVSNLQLTNGGVSLVILDQPVELLIGIQDGALVIPDLLGGGPLDLLAPFADDPWRLTAATVTTAGMDIEAAVDARAILAGSGSRSGPGSGSG
jgi:hypothetical protein